MVEYKVVQHTYKSTFETNINNLAKDGWRVVSFSVTPPGVTVTPTYNAIMEKE